MGRKKHSQIRRQSNQHTEPNNMKILQSPTSHNNKYPPQLISSSNSSIKDLITANNSTHSNHSKPPNTNSNSNSNTNTNTSTKTNTKTNINTNINTNMSGQIKNSNKNILGPNEDTSKKARRSLPPEIRECGSDKFNNSGGSSHAKQIHKLKQIKLRNEGEHSNLSTSNQQLMLNPAASPKGGATLLNRSQKSISSISPRTDSPAASNSNSNEKPFIIPAESPNKVSTATQKPFSQTTSFVQFNDEITHERDKLIQFNQICNFYYFLYFENYDFVRLCACSLLKA